MFKFYQFFPPSPFKSIKDIIRHACFFKSPKVILVGGLSLE